MPSRMSDALAAFGPMVERILVVLAVVWVLAILIAGVRLWRTR